MKDNQASWHRWDDMPKEKVSETLERRLITGDRIMLTHVYLKKGCIVPRHCHHNEQFTYILDGVLHFWLGENGEEPHEEEPASEDDLVALVKETFDAREVQE